MPVRRYFSCYYNSDQSDLELFGMNEMLKEIQTKFPGLEFDYDNNSEPIDCSVCSGSREVNFTDPFNEQWCKECVDRFENDEEFRNSKGWDITEFR